MARPVLSMNKKRASKSKATANKAKVAAQSLLVAEQKLFEIEDDLYSLSFEDFEIPDIEHDENAEAIFAMSREEFFRLPNLDEVVNTQDVLSNVLAVEPIEEVAAITPEPLSDIWQVCFEASVGMSHRKMSPAVPCQDSCLATQSPRLALFVCDGAGSSKLSHVGSQTLVQSLNRLVFSMEGLLANYLDTTIGTEKAGLKLADIFYRYAWHQMKDLAESHHRSDSDFRSTLLMLVVGREQLFWLKVGDGHMLYQNREGARHVIGESDKGEFANQTVFMDCSLSFEQVQFGLLPSTDVTGIALMSDGAAERLVSNDGSQSAPLLSNWFEQLKDQKLRADHLFRFFNEPETWQGSTHDDKSMALAAR